MFVIFFSGHMDNKCLATAMFIKEVDTYSTASMVSHAVLTTESFYVVVLPVPVSTWNTGEVQLIR